MRAASLVLPLLVVFPLLLGTFALQDSPEASASDHAPLSEDDDNEANFQLLRASRRSGSEIESDTRKSTLRLEQNHLKAIGFDDDVDNICLRVCFCRCDRPVLVF